MRNFFQDILNENATGFADQLSLAGSGTVFSGYAPFFQDVLKKNAAGLGLAIIPGPIWGRFFQDTLALFQDILNKNAGGLGPAIISSPIRRRFCSGYAGVFFQDTTAR